MVSMKKKRKQLVLEQWIQPAQHITSGLSRGLLIFCIVAPSNDKPVLKQRATASSMHCEKWLC